MAYTRYRSAPSDGGLPEPTPVGLDGSGVGGTSGGRLRRLDSKQGWEK
jgi:hypothetical protein